MVCMERQIGRSYQIIQSRVNAGEFHTGFISHIHVIKPQSAKLAKII